MLIRVNHAPPLRFVGFHFALGFFWLPAMDFAAKCNRTFALGHLPKFNRTAIPNFPGSPLARSMEPFTRHFN